MNQKINDKSINKGQLSRIFESQQGILHSHKVKNINERLKNIKAIYRWIIKNRNQIVKTISLELHKSEMETNLNEIMVVLSEARNAIRNLKKWTAAHHVGRSLAFVSTRAKITYEPKGVVLIISPWNFPLNLVICPLISAIAAGNTVFIKPSEFTPETNQMIKKMITELFEEDHVCMIEGDASITKLLLELPFNHIFFTGSTKVGKEIMRLASNHLASVTLELGGKSPVFLGKISNLQEACDKIIWGKLMNNGQACLAPDYIVVESSMQNQVKDALIQSIKRLYGSSLRENKDYGKIINSHHFQRLKHLFHDAMNKGASLEYGGQFDDEYHYISPTILSNISSTSDIYQEEIFGPILLLMNYKSIQDAIWDLQKKPKPLALYIFSDSKKEISNIHESLQAGSTCVNDVLIQYFHPNLPMGGVNQSGFGSSHGVFGFKSFSHERAFLKQGLFSFLPMVYPPYSSTFKKSIIEFVSRYI